MNSDGVDMAQPIGPRGEDIGLRCLRVQGESFGNFMSGQNANMTCMESGGFPMPNPTSDLSSAYALKPDFSFAFKDWIKGGVETLIWSFKGTCLNWTDSRLLADRCSFRRRVFRSMYFGHLATPVQIPCGISRHILDPALFAHDLARSQAATRPETSIGRRDYHATLRRG